MVNSTSAGSIDSYCHIYYNKHDRCAFSIQVLTGEAVAREMDVRAVLGGGMNLPRPDEFRMAVRQYVEARSLPTIRARRTRTNQRATVADPDAVLDLMA